jgi:21S rRNA (uridine2791-2'-O)-methyltransferase
MFVRSPRIYPVPDNVPKVAVDLTKPNGRVVGVDIIPAQPPKGVSTIQGNFLSPRIQAYVQEFLRNPDRGRARPDPLAASDRQDDTTGEAYQDGSVQDEPGYIDREREMSAQIEGSDESTVTRPASDDASGDRTVDVVLSDMSAPWQQTAGFWKRSLNDPYHRMMNTSGLGFRDHAGSMVCEIVRKDHLRHSRVLTAGNCRIYALPP